MSPKMYIVLVLWLLANLPEASSNCGQVNSNELKSPNYPYDYPNYLDCVYQVSIPADTVMNISFHEFIVENFLNCGFDYLKITNDNNQTVGVYCGTLTGTNVVVNGSYFTITFHSDSSLSYKGYWLIFSPVPVLTQPPPTMYPTPGTVSPATGGPHPSFNPSADPQSKLRCLLITLQALIDEMSDIVDNELTGSGNVQVSVREYKARVKRALTEVHTAKKSDGRQKLGVMKTMMIDQLEKKAADLIKQLETKEARYQKREMMKEKLAMLAPRKA